MVLLDCTLSLYLLHLYTCKYAGTKNISTRISSHFQIKFRSCLVPVCHLKDKKSDNHKTVLCDVYLTEEPEDNQKVLSLGENEIF